MKQAKILSSYRLPEQTRAQIKHLAEKYRESESEIVRIATSELYEKYAKIKDLSKSELLRRAKNLDNGKGIFLTDEEFEKQSGDG